MAPKWWCGSILFVYNEEKRRAILERDAETVRENLSSETKAWFGSISPTRIPPRQKVRVRLGDGESGEMERRGRQGAGGGGTDGERGGDTGVAVGTAGGGDGDPKRV